jgi:L,D-peptidoglycan transpeptidase YkuD (ErfK/YbiS/YcfS/YnhG family)
VLVLLAFLAASPVPAHSRQLVLSICRNWDGTSAEVRRYERSLADLRWSAVGRPMDAALGTNGLAWGRGLQPNVMPGPVKREGDGRSPAGVFSLRSATGYAAKPPAGTQLPYQRATEFLHCVDDPASPHYNQLVDDTRTAKDWSSAEDMRRADDLYRLVVWVGHNDAGAEPGAGSCIFLHIKGSSTTAGCTAFDAYDMEELFRWLDPSAQPVLVQLPADVWNGVRRAWDLP